MTTGWVVVVVGGVVVVVVVVGEVGDGAPPPEGTPLPVEPEMAGAVVLVVLVEVVGAGVTGGTVLGDGADEPGCSLATMTPMNAVAPPATSTANLVSRLTRSCARAGGRRKGGSVAPHGVEVLCTSIGTRVSRVCIARRQATRET